MYSTTEVYREHHPVNCPHCKDLGMAGGGVPIRFYACLGETSVSLRAPYNRDDHVVLIMTDVNGRSVTAAEYVHRLDPSFTAMGLFNARDRAITNGLLIDFVGMTRGDRTEVTYGDALGRLA